jgi:eukaryotic-like serine/threonine-protein kinase
MAHHLYAHLLIETGRTQESIAEAQRALDLDPYSPFINNGLARQYYLSRQYDKAIAQCQVGLQINPTYLPARIQLALAYEQTRNLAGAVSELEQAAAMLAAGNRAQNAAGHPIAVPLLTALLGHAYALSGRQSEALTQLKRLQSDASQSYIPPSYIAIVWMALGNKNEAINWLEKGYQDRSEHMLYLGIEPLVDPLRGDPRFDSLVQRIGLASHN